MSFLRCVTLIIFVGSLLGCTRESDSSVPVLMIVSSNGSSIKYEFERAFARWHREKYGGPVRIEWPTIGSNGSSDIKNQLNVAYVQNKQESSGYDMVFGGGSALFNDYVKLGALEPPQMTPGLAAALAVAPKDLHGTALRATGGAGDLWFASTLSNFGIVLNKTRMSELHLATPKVWSDLAGGEWFGEVSLADPSKSSSAETCFEMIVQQYGWAEGWPILVTLFANADAVEQGGATPGAEAASGNATAGILIDFFGRTAIIKQGVSVMTFVVPAGGSTLDADPIAVLKGAPHAELAAHFLEFVLSAAGQKLWVQQPATPEGPEKYALGRLAILPELYEKDAAYMTDPHSPFTAASPLKLNPKTMVLRSPFFGDLMKAALIDNHEALKAARKAVRAAGDAPALLARFNELPFAEGELEAVNGEWRDAAGKVRLIAEWRKRYAALFAEIEREARRGK